MRRILGTFLMLAVGCTTLGGGECPPPDEQSVDKGRLGQLKLGLSCFADGSPEAAEGDSDAGASDAGVPPADASDNAAP